MHTVGDTATGQGTVRTAHVNVGCLYPAKARQLEIRRAINRSRDPAARCGLRRSQRGNKKNGKTKPKKNSHNHPIMS